MSQQWQRHITLTDTLRLLDDIQLIVDVPQKLQQLEEGKVGGVGREAGDTCWGEGGWVGSRVTRL